MIGAKPRLPAKAIRAFAANLQRCPSWGSELAPEGTIEIGARLFDDGRAIDP
jgi:hypothetical protein